MDFPDYLSRMDQMERIIDLLLKTWEEHPNLRLCQLVSNLHGVGPQDIFYTSDGDFERLLKKGNV